MSEGNLGSPSPLNPSDAAVAHEQVKDDSAVAVKAPALSVEPIPEDLLDAVRGAQAKKAEDLRIFDLRGVTSLTEYFLICGGTNQRQNQAISDEILRSLKETRNRAPMGVEGYEKADWILMDYGDFIVHILSGQARKYYDLERLWRQAKECEVPPDLVPEHLASKATS
ncbi:MAG: ribosome silencing factor [Bryobacterales bacterium]|nr:ribosome silencing factor [Bryobacterales bacterium]